MPGEPAQFILPDAYPQLVPPAAANGMARTLRSAVTAVRATRVIEENGEALRLAVRAYVEELEEAGADHALVAEMAHEIKGFAETAGMLATGRIAEGLCRYFDESERLGTAPDSAVVALHVSALGRVARDPDMINQMSGTVARELGVLADRKLAESQTRGGAALNAR